MSKKVLLTFPHLRSSPFGLSEPIIPNGLGYIAASLENNGHIVRIVDNYLPPTDTWEEPVNYCEELQKFQPDFVGIYVHTIGFSESLEIIQMTKEKSNARIVCGGPHATLNPFMFPSDVDYVVIGEGEIALVDVVENKVKNEFLSGKYISYPKINNLDELPMPAWHHFVGKEYQWDINSKFGLTAPTFNFNTSRGCIYSCKFCSVKKLWGKYRAFSPEKIVNEIEKLINKYGAKSIYFREDCFVASRKRVTDFCELLKQRRIDIEWAIEARVDIVKDNSLLEILKQAGCRGIEVGMESGSQRILDSIDKGITVEAIEDFFKLSHDIGIASYASIIYGIPGETEEDREKTEILLDKVKPDRIRRGVYLGLPGSNFYDQLLESRNYERMDDNGIIYSIGYKDLATRIYGQPDSYRVGRDIY